MLMQEQLAAATSGTREGLRNLSGAGPQRPQASVSTTSEDTRAGTQVIKR